MNPAPHRHVGQTKARLNPHWNPAKQPRPSARQNRGWTHNPHQHRLRGGAGNRYWTGGSDRFESFPTGQRIGPPRRSKIGARAHRNGPSPPSVFEVKLSQKKLSPKNQPPRLSPRSEGLAPTAISLRGELRSTYRLRALSSGGSSLRGLAPRAPRRGPPPLRGPGGSEGLASGGGRVQPSSLNPSWERLPRQGPLNVFVGQNS